MKRRLTILALTALAVVALITVVLTVTSPAQAGGPNKIAGVGDDKDVGNCTDLDSDLLLRMTGDLDGCLYTFIESSECSPSGEYRETGTEVFIGNYNGQPGRFGTTYVFKARFTECDVNTGTPGGDEIVGGCIHPIVAGSGEGVFEGVTGGFQIQDIIELYFPRMLNRQ